MRVRYGISDDVAVLTLLTCRTDLPNYDSLFVVQFRGAYQGSLHAEFMKWIDRQDAFLKNELGGYALYYGRNIAIVQSSGVGKTRLIFEVCMNMQNVATQIDTSVIEIWF